MQNIIYQEFVNQQSCSIVISRLKKASRPVRDEENNSCSHDYNIPTAN